MDISIPYYLNLPSLCRVSLKSRDFSVGENTVPNGRAIGTLQSFFINYIQSRPLLISAQQGPFPLDEASSVWKLAKKRVGLRDIVSRNLWSTFLIHKVSCFHFRMLTGPPPSSPQIPSQTPFSAPINPRSGDGSFDSAFELAGRKERLSTVPLSWVGWWTNQL